MESVPSEAGRLSVMSRVAPAVVPRPGAMASGVDAGMANRSAQGEALWCPPHLPPLTPVRALLRVLASGDGNLLSLLPASAYQVPIGYLGYSRRSIVIVNDPVEVRRIMTDAVEDFPKSDLMVGALAPLVGDSMFVSGGATWARQRCMIDPAFSHMRVGRAYTCMRAAVDDYEQHWQQLAARGEAFSLDLAMSHLTADIICRTVFSTSLESDAAREVFDAFTIFERSVAHVALHRLILDPAWKTVQQPAPVRAACERIRHHLGVLVDRHQAKGGKSFDDIAAAVMEARDLDSGEPFSREELLDQLGVMFLAGHETTASALTWAFFILSQQPAVLARMRAEIAQVCGDGPIEFEQAKKLVLVRNVFRETLRLYPPITFIPRVAMHDSRIQGVKVKRGALVMIAPWTLHRHRSYWAQPDAFDPDRFSPARERDMVPGTYIPFGQGPRVCVGAAFATVEATLILAQLLRRFDVEVNDPSSVMPVARLTTRPARQIMCRVRERVLATTRNGHLPADQ